MLYAISSKAGPIPIRYDILPQLGIVAVTFEGAVTARDVVETAEAYHRHYEEQRIINCLVDGSRKHDLRVDFIQMLSLVNRLRQMPAFRDPNGFMAIYAPDDVPFGMARMYQSLALTTDGPQIGVFRDKHAALEFVSVEDAMLTRVAPAFAGF